MSGTYWDNHLSKDVLGHSTLQDTKAVLIGGSEVKARMFWAIDRMLIFFACAPRGGLLMRSPKSLTTVPAHGRLSPSGLLSMAH